MNQPLRQMQIEAGGIEFKDVASPMTASGMSSKHISFGSRPDGGLCRRDRVW